MQTTAEQPEDPVHRFTTKVEELGRRFNLGTIEEQITAHPWPAIGIAFVVGGVLGLVTGGRSREVEERRSIGGLIASAVGAIAMKLLKSYAVSVAADQAKSWMASRPGATEQAASRDPSVEEFFDH